MILFSELRPDGAPRIAVLFVRRHEPLELFDPIEDNMNLVGLTSVDHQQLAVWEHVESDVAGGV